MVKPTYQTDSLCIYHPWTVVDIAWENDLEPLEDAA